MVPETGLCTHKLDVTFSSATLSISAITLLRELNGNKNTAFLRKLVCERVHSTNYRALTRGRTDHFCILTAF